MVIRAESSLSMVELGIPSLDAKVGKIPRETSLIIIGDPGVGKTVFLGNVVRGTLHKNGKAIWTTTDLAPQDVRVILDSLGCNVEEKEAEEAFRIVDCFSYRVPELPHEKWVIRVENPVSLWEIDAAVTKAMDALGGVDVLVFDGLSSLIFESGDRATLKFFRELTARLRMKNVFNLWSLERGAHSEVTLNSFKAVSSGVIEMWFEATNGLERYMRFTKMIGAALPTERIRFQIGADASITV